MLRYLTLAALFLAALSPARAATISIGGDFHLTEPAPYDKLIVTTSTAFVQRFLPQLPLDQRHTFDVPANQLYFLVFNNMSRNALGDAEHALQFHFGGWLSDEPNAYMNASTIEMIGGPLVDLGGGDFAQEWTYIVDGGAPEVVQVAMIPEPAGFALIIPTVLGILARRRFAARR